MSPLQVVSLAGVQNKVVSWRCDAHDVEAGLAHPLQSPKSNTFTYVSDSVSTSMMFSGLRSR